MNTDRCPQSCHGAPTQCIYILHDSLEGWVHQCLRTWRPRAVKATDSLPYTLKYSFIHSHTPQPVLRRPKQQCTANLTSHSQQLSTTPPWLVSKVSLYSSPTTQHTGGRPSLPAGAPSEAPEPPGATTPAASSQPPPAHAETFAVTGAAFLATSSSSATNPSIVSASF